MALYLFFFAVIPTVHVFRTILWKNINCKDATKLEEFVDSAGVGESQITVTTCLTVAPEMKHTEGQEIEEWVALCFELAVRSQLDLSKYNVKACVEVSLYDRKAGRCPCEEVPACHVINTRNRSCNFSIPLVRKCEVEKCEELEIEIDGEVTSESAFPVPIEERGDNCP